MARVMNLASDEAYECEFEYLVSEGERVMSLGERSLLIDSSYDPPLCDLVKAVKTGHIIDFIRV